MEQQVSLFDFEQANDVRTEKQKNRQVAYDVGEKLHGARKDEVALKKAFEKKQSFIQLQQLEDIGPVIAAEMVNRDLLFQDFSIEQEKVEGTVPSVARVKQLIIQRIDKVPAEDSQKGRADFLRAALFYKKTMESVHTFDDLKDKIYELREIMNYEGINLDYAHGCIRVAEEKIEKLNTKENALLLKKAKRDLKRCKLLIKKSNRADELLLKCLGKKFSNFFISAKSANNTLSNVRSKVKTWNDLESTKREKRKVIRRVWERELPERPDRTGGKKSMIYTPQSLQETFSLRGVQFGHWTNDDIGANHLFRFSEAFYDLSEMLQINDHRSLSFNNRLGIAFGSRGRGKSLAHYEVIEKVINFTRDKGSLGNTAHEWFHGLDHWLYDLSHAEKNGQYGFITSLNNYGQYFSEEVVFVVRELMDAIMKGDGIKMLKNKNDKNTHWRLTARLKRLYRSEDGNIKNAIIAFKEEQEEQLEKHLQFVSNFHGDLGEEKKEKMRKKNERELNKMAQALAWIHECESGERLDEIPIPCDQSNFYLEAQKLDKGKKGYWSSSHEMAARAFESYIEDKLKSQCRRNDYLVCGTHDKFVFPVGQERERINQSFDQFMDVIRLLFI